MKAWWENLSQRERMLLGGGAVIVAVLILLQFVLSPLISWRTDVRAEAETAERNYELVARAAATAPGHESVDEETPVRNVLNDAASRNRVNLTFVNALPDGSVSLQAGPVTAENVFSLFDDLERSYAVRVVNADIARAPEDAGLVRLQATVSR